jgi:glycosyl transferase family 25
MTSAPLIYVINLDRSEERMEKMSAWLADHGLAHTRVPAVRADEWADGMEGAVYDREANRRGYLAPLEKEEVACILSHRRVWRMFLESGAPAAVVLEDDVIPLIDHGAWAGAMAPLAREETPTLWKLNALTGGAKPVHGPFRLSRPLLPALTSAAHAMNRSAAERFLEFTRTFHEPVDATMQRWWDHGVQVWACHPALLHEDRRSGYASTISSPGRPPAEGRILREIRRPVFRARRFARALCAKMAGGL